MWATMALGVVRASAVSWNKVTGALHLRVLLNRLLKKHQGDTGWPLSRQTPPYPPCIMGICEEQPGVHL